MVAALKTRTLVTIAVFAIGAVLPLALAAETVVEEAIASYRDIEGSCASYPLRPLSARESEFIDGKVTAHVTNEGDAADARVCLFDGKGVKRMDVTIHLAAGERRDVVFETPPGVYTFRQEAGNALQTSVGTGTMNTRWCLGNSDDVELTFFVTADSVGGSSSAGGGCIPGSFAVGLMGLVASGGTFALGKFPGSGALLLYSRLAKPRLLDSSVRARVMDLVAREPGIHSREIVRSLDAADGQTAYHLGVLARERMLVSVGVPGMRHWFVAGRFRPEQMRAISALRDPTRRRMYEAVVADPGASLGEVVEIIGISLPQGSRAARALERAGLIERKASGRALSLTPMRAPGEVYGAARESAPA